MTTTTTELTTDELRGLGMGTRLRNRHTGQETRVTAYERGHHGEPRVTIDWNQAAGRPADVGATVDGLLEHWEIVG